MAIRKYVIGYAGDGLRVAAVIAVLSMVCSVSTGLPADETIGQWVWFDRASLGVLPCILLSFLWRRGEKGMSFGTAVVWALMLLGGVEAGWGLCQLYGSVASRHSLYALTGSFFNPGPYSGYLAMTLPVCLHQWLARSGPAKNVAGGVALLILCVLPAGMSRSAWLAAGFSCLWVYGGVKGWKEQMAVWWRQHRKHIPVAVAIGLCLLLVAGWCLFSLKPDSARGRLFMWKMACRAIAEKPFAGYGISGFSSAYADAQEAYFATGDYALWEEYVAGSPEYAFNEYLQAAVELGIPLTAGLLIVVAFCLWMGMRKGRLGLCGALLSLMIFSFSSYPLQLPVGIVTFPVLLWACVESGGRGAWLLFALLAGGTGLFRLQDDRQMERACREWANVRVLYRAGASRPVTEGYEKLYPVLKERAAFLFEYGHALHKSKQFEASNRILQEALLHSSDPMILNIIGKNHQEMGDYPSAEAWLLRSTHRLPGRIYPYYLLAKLYALPAYRQPDKFEKMKQLVLTKEPKVHSTAVRQMREEVKGLKIKD